MQTIVIPAIPNPFKRDRPGPYYSPVLLRNIPSLKDFRDNSCPTSKDAYVECSLGIAMLPEFILDKWLKIYGEKDSITLAVIKRDRGMSAKHMWHFRGSFVIGKDSFDYLAVFFFDKSIGAIEIEIPTLEQKK